MQGFEQIMKLIQTWTHMSFNFCETIFLACNSVFVRWELILSGCVSRPVRNCGTCVATWKMETPSIKHFHYTFMLTKLRTGRFWHIINDGRNKNVNKEFCHVVFTWAIHELMLHFLMYFWKIWSIRKTFPQSKKLVFKVKLFLKV